MNRGHVPTRMCVICRCRASRHELTRYVLQADAEEKKDRAVLFKDERQICPGRGFYVCADEACVEKFLQFRAGGRKRKGESA